MHDPMTVAFTIKRPWPQRRSVHVTRTGESVTMPRYWPSWATIWHVDPESDGSDDSCGWSFPKAAPEDRAWPARHAEHYWSQRFGNSTGGFHHASSLEILTSVWCEVRTQYTKKREGYIWLPLPRRDRDEILQLCISSVDNLHDAIQHARTGPAGMEELLRLVIRLQRRLYRSWWRHPRWHIWHWRIQVQPLQSLKRFLFARCLVCGGRFGWNESACSSWDGGERIWHCSCDQHDPGRVANTLMVRRVEEDVHKVR